MFELLASVLVLLVWYVIFYAKDRTFTVYNIESVCRDLFYHGFLDGYQEGESLRHQIKIVSKQEDSHHDMV